MDLDVASKDLDIEDRARENGKSDLPESDNLEYDAPQREIKACIDGNIAQISNYAMSSHNPKRRTVQTECSKW